MALLLDAFSEKNELWNRAYLTLTEQFFRFCEKQNCLISSFTWINFCVLFIS